MPVEYSGFYATLKGKNKSYSPFDFGPQMDNKQPRVIKETT